MQLPVVLLVVIISVLVTSVAFFIFGKRKKGESTKKLPENPVVFDASTRAREVVLEAKDLALKVKTEAEEHAAKVREQVNELEKKITLRTSEITAKEKELDAKSVKIEELKTELLRKKAEIDALLKQQQEKLQAISLMTKDEARKQLLESFTRELAEEKGKRIRENEEEVKRESERISQQILVDAMRHGATDYVVEYTVSKLKLPDDDVKGRIIGKEGRNIKTFEELTGVDLELDSTPGEVIISSFDPVRREIAKLSLERLIADGRIQPTRIEEIIEKTKTEVEHIMYKEGDNLCHRLGVYNLQKELVQILGRFKYRFSYGQNMIEHTLEETKIGVAIANELSANANIVKLGCLLHDIGKVVADEEGTHVQLGVDLLRKFRVSEEVINCVAEHHEDKPFSSLESSIVNLADHVSGARPAARSEDYESYVRRMKDLETAAYAFDGVDKAYAVSAGREVRVFVKPNVVDDSATAFIAREIAKKIELEQTYPGTVKVTVIRETRASETAK